MIKNALIFALCFGLFFGILKYHKLPETPVPVQKEQSGKIKKYVPSFKSREIKCLTENIYYEASHEPEKGKQAVGLVTLNRVKSKSYPKTVCATVYQRTKNKQGKTVCQFSWTCGVKKKFNRKEWKSASIIATKLYNTRNRVYDFTHGSTHFHAGSLVWPDWSDLEYTTDIGGHVFYRKKKIKDNN